MWCDVLNWGGSCNCVFTQLVSVANCCKCNTSFQSSHVMSPPRSPCHLFSSMLRASLFGKASPLAQRVTDGRVARGRECPVPTHSKKTCETCDRICSPSCDLENLDHICDDAGAHWESSAGSQALQFDSNIFLILYVVINSWCQFFRFVKIDYWLWLSYGWFGWLTNRQDSKLKLKTA